MNPLPNEYAKLIQAAIQAAQAAGDLPEFDMPDIPIDRPKLAEQGDYTTPIAMPLAKVARRKPLDIATAIARHLPDAPFIGRVEVAPPGYINFHLNDAWLRERVHFIIEAGDSYGKVDSFAGQRAQVEFLSANPTGPITIGRTRGAILGEGIARVLEAAGYAVTREYYFNNAGAQMRKLGESLRIRYLEALGKPVQLPGKDDEDFYQGDYLIQYAEDLIKEVGDAWAEEDWKPFKEYGEKRIFDWIRQTLERVNIRHDIFFNENSVYESGAVMDTLKRLDEAGYIYVATEREQATEDEAQEKKEKRRQNTAPATWFRSTRIGDVEDRVVVKSDGEPTYTLPDIAYHINKIERGFDLLVNVLGSDHKTEAAVVRMGLEALGYRVDHLHVVLMQMVRMMKDGELFKGSTRRGNYITLDELIDATSTDAVQYFMLHRSPESEFTFDVDLAVKQSNENPVYYIQYAYVRCRGIFREAEARNFDDDGADLSLLDDEALDFIRKVLELPERVEFAAKNLTPHTIAHYALELANFFHPMYDRVRVFGEGVDPDLAKARLRFYRAAQTAFARVLDLMGMTQPERM